MIREDYGLGFLLKYENVAWYENGAVRILDRRVYPMKKEYFTARTYEEVAVAIKDMVTQSGGPFSAAAMGMVLASENCKNKSEKEQLAYMKKAVYALSHARPTTSAEMQKTTDACLEKFTELLNNSCSNIPEKMFDFAIECNNKRYKLNCDAGKFLAAVIPNNSRILTQCFGETAFGGLFRALKEADKTVKIICAETRPFLQGARLTASLASDMGFDTTVITDNMPACSMAEKNIDFFVSASDLITMDGCVVNKVGTMQIALVANYFQVPYFAFGIPCQSHKNADSVVIEYRNPNEILHFAGIKTCLDTVQGWYPAFDITPADLCTGIVTEKGIFEPNDIYKYFL